ncbi:MAG: hypothetical protein ABW208_25675 [Pyrinomonadaceae bacterium]
MSMPALSAPRFVRRTSLGPGEYRKNFRQIDREVIEAVTSPEADAVTPLMGKIYLRLVNAPPGCWERDGVLRFEYELREAGRVKAWSVLCEVLGVASATANKALRWMHEQGIIGYFAGKNGVGIRIFLNRAASSVGKKILEFPPASSGARPASPDETALNDSYAVSEDLESDLNSRAPKNGADTNGGVKTPSEIEPAEVTGAVPVGEIVRRLRNELEPCVRKAAAQAAAREHERTREWLERSGIPKATRVAQHEAYNVLRSHGLINSSAGRARAGLEVGRADDARATAAGPLTPEEITETAETCVALLEAQGKAIDVTLSEISSEGGGWLLPQDAPRVREAAQALLRERAERR